jgi:hypothetical protein
MGVMRRGALSIGITLALAAASLAAAQDAPRPRVTVVIKSPPPSASATTATAKSAPALPGQPALRKPLGPAAAAGRAPPAHAFASAALAAPVVKGGVTPLKGLNGPSALAVAAQCRAQCAEARYMCTAQEAGDCDTVWGECVVRCSGANYTSAPALAFSPPYRPGP